MPGAAATAAEEHTARSVIALFRGEILAEWKRTVRAMPVAADLSAVALADHIAELLDEVAELADAHGQTETPPSSQTFDTARKHAIARLSAGFDVSAVVRELSILRRCTLTVWSRECPTSNADDRLALDMMFDQAIEASVARYVEARDRTLAAIDTISTASLEATSLDDLLQRLLTVFMGTTASVQTCAILLRDDHDQLRTRAAVGLDADVASPVVKGEGIAGRVWAEGRPLEIRAASDEKRVRALYALPLVQDERVIGVAHMGSRSANQFSDEDKHLFGSMCARATVGISHQMLRERLAVAEEQSKLVAAERERAHEALRVEQDRLESILEHTPAAIWIKDAAGRVVLANRRVADVLSVSHDLVGHRSEDVLPEDVAEQHRASDLVVMREGRALEVEEIVPAPGGTRTFLSIKFPIPGDPPFVGGIAMEITERKRIEEELRSAVRARDEILAVVSHDLRNPLGTVRLGTSLLLAENPSDPRTRRHLDSIYRASNRMETLIDDLLDTANIRAGHLKLDTKPEMADSVLREAVELQQPLAAEKGIELRRSADVDGVEVICDRDRILQVFANLIGNALKVCRAGDTITVTADRTDTDVRFTVADSGPGIAPSAAAHLFDAYWSGADRAKRGVGLGLYICRGIVEGHGGRISVESTPGEGARFSFTLPLAHAA